MSASKVLLREREQAALSRRLWRAYAAYQASRGVVIGPRVTLDEMAAELYAAYVEAVNADTVEQVRRDLRRAAPSGRARIIRSYAPRSLATCGAAL